MNDNKNKDNAISAKNNMVEFSIDNTDPPSLGKRFSAFVIDALIAGIPFAVLAVFLLIPVFFMMAYAPLPAIYENELLYYSMYMLFAVSLFWFILYSLFRDGFSGRSIGKRICRLIVVDLESNSPCSMKKSALRNLYLLLITILHWIIPLFGLLTFLIEPIAVLTSPQGLRFGDRLAKTKVISYRSSEEIL